MKPSAHVLPPALQPAPAAVTTGLEEPPADLGDREKTVWRALAPRAIAERTLIEATVPGFRELCEQLVVKEDIAAASAGAVNQHRWLALLLKAQQRVDVTLDRYRLTARGQAAPPPAKPAAPNPFAFLDKKPS
jgi:hypothetical protein